MHKFRIPAGASAILNRLQSNGFEAYLVGGCVRDSLLGKTSKDWDVCTSATPAQILDCFYDKQVIKTGLQHGTVTVVLEDGRYEVTTFRADGEYLDNRHPDSVRFITSIREDLSRRDFTVNAMAYNEQYGLVDPFGGYVDLRNKTLSCVGNSDDRFNEDALRIMRALRFSSVYGFRISEATAASIHKNAHLLDNIAVERINTELCKLLCGDGALQVLLDYSDVISTIIPEMEPCVGFNQNNRYHEYTVYDHMAHAVSNYGGDDIVVKVALLLHDIGKPCCYTEDENGGHFHGHSTFSREISEKVLTKLRFDKESKEDILELILYHDATIEPTQKTARKWLNKIGEKQFARLLDIRMADILAHAEGTQASRIERCVSLRNVMEDVIKNNQCFKLKDLKIDGYDVMSLLGIPEGKEVGAILKSVLNGVINGDIPNDRVAIAEYLITKQYKRILG